MILEVSISESNQRFIAEMDDSGSQVFRADFGNVLVVERADIPPQYGLVTYDNNRTITVT